MTSKRLLPLCLLVLATGCLVSEQTGEPVGHGTSRMAGEDVAIHFDTDFNRIVLFGRSAALVVIGLWVVSAWGLKPRPILVGGALLAASGWLFFKDYPVLEGYRLEVAAEGLTLKVPPDLGELVPWETIEELELEGFGYARVGGGPRFTGPGMSQPAGLELPDWKTMKLTLTGGKTHLIRLDGLSIEHREIFANALIERAGLVEVE